MAQLNHNLPKLLSANRKLTFICGVQAILITVLVLTGWRSQSNQLTLQRLAIVDSSGHERVVLRGGDNGDGVILVDSKGRVRCGLTVDSDLPGLRMYDENNQARTGLEINPTGPNLDFLAANGNYVQRLPSGVKHAHKRLGER